MSDRPLGPSIRLKPALAKPCINGQQLQNHHSTKRHVKSQAIHLVRLQLSAILSVTGPAAKRVTNSLITLVGICGLFTTTGLVISAIFVAARAASRDGGLAEKTSLS